MPATMKQAQAAAEFLKRFIGPRQLKFTLSLCRGEEGQFFIDKLVELHALITNMPKIYEQNGKGEDAIVSLHYFKRGADWWITEKDSGDSGEDMLAEQHQAFGMVDLGLFENGLSLGYISIVELMENHVEIDYHWTPKTIREVKTSRVKKSRV